ncbi:MAG: protein kinase [Gemmatales bacterium]|nr:protein kinase [Gemmatales bacterium]MDW8174745.1 protein kinase [Gemmatales bacterium]
MSEETQGLGNSAPGSILVGRYRLVQLLGMGGQSQVWLAEDTRLKRKVAVKLLRAERASQPGSLARFLLEAEITARLNHPGVPSIHDLGFMDGGCPYIVMRIVQGKSLKEILEEVWGTPAKPRSVVREHLTFLLGVFEQVCQTLSYAHSQGYIHRDLKPSNIMVGAHGEVQVMDWGLAKCLHFLVKQETVESNAVVPVDETLEADLLLRGEASDWDSGMGTETGTVLGTPAYMAPEQAAGEIHKLDPRSDVFGLGAVLCEILTGQPPYVGKNAHETRIQAMRWHIQPAWERLDRAPVSQEWVELCKRCLSFDPEQRPTDAGALAQQVAQLRQAAEQRAQRAERERAEALVRELEQRKRRRQFMVFSATVILVLSLATVLLCWAWYKTRQAAEAECQARAQAEERQKLAEYHQQRAEQALRAEKEARQAEAVSRSNERHARREVLRVLRDLTDDALETLLLRVNNFSEEEQAFLERLAKHLEALARVRGEDLPSRELRAEGYMRLGLLYYRVKKLAEAESALLSALAEWQPLLTLHRDSLAYGLGESRTWLVLSFVYRIQYRLAEARKALH